MRPDSVVIVGGGLAAAKTAEHLRADGFDGPITLIGAEEHLPYERPALSKDYLAGKVDAELTAQAPRLGPHRAAMVQCIAQALQMAPDQVNVKAKTAEKLGPVGQGASIEARAVVLLIR